MTNKVIVDEKGQVLIPLSKREPETQIECIAKIMVEILMQSSDYYELFVELPELSTKSEDRINRWMCKYDRCPKVEIKRGDK